MLKKEDKTGDDAVDLHSVKLSGGYHMEELPSHAFTVSRIIIIILFSNSSS